MANLRGGSGTCSRRGVQLDGRCIHHCGRDPYGRNSSWHSNRGWSRSHRFRRAGGHGRSWHGWSRRLRSRLDYFGRSWCGRGGRHRGNTTFPNLHHDRLARRKQTERLGRLQVHHHPCYGRIGCHTAYANGLHFALIHRDGAKLRSRNGIGKVDHQAIGIGDHLCKRHHALAGFNLDLHRAPGLHDGDMSDLRVLSRSCGRQRKNEGSSQERDPGDLGEVGHDLNTFMLWILAVCGTCELHVSRRTLACGAWRLVWMRHGSRIGASERRKPLFW